MSESYRERVCGILQNEGIQVRYKCRSAAEAMRAIRNMGGGVIICGYKLADMTANDLSYDLPEAAYMLIMASSENLRLVENENIFKLPLPATRGEVLASVKILMKVEEKHFKETLPQRSPMDETFIKRAKELLVEKNDMTEQESHRFLQQKSMNTGIGKAEVARLIVEAYDSSI